MLFIGALINSCGSGGAGSSGTSYGGPGSAYTATFTPGNGFSIEKRTTVGGSVDFTVAGTYVTLSSGFLKLTVDSVTGSGGPTVGAQAYGLQIPGFAFLLKPFDSGEIIPMVALNDCPTSDLSLNWIVTDYDGGSSLISGADLFGTFSYTYATNSPSIPTRYDLGYNSLGAGTSLTIDTCSGGVVTIDGGAGNMWLTQGGGALVRTAGGTIVATKSAYYNPANIVKTFTGILFDQSQSGANQTQPLSITFNSTSSGTGAVYTDVENGVVSTTDVATISVSSHNSPSNGFFKTTVTTAAGSNPMLCQVSANAGGSGKTMLFCVGVSPGDGTNTKLYNMIGISQ
ncbi:MAG: hypothetical protein CL678_07965 [Bdellovibrionaceae bacterium]|nr:hypothetical protein [Pseudobdellovibrionaceae bacterium]